MGNILFYLVQIKFWFWSFLPLWMLHGISNVIFYIVYYVVRYRRDVVKNNLLVSFPEKSENELLKLEKGFYRHLCDVGVQAIKMSRMSDQQMRKRFVFTNPEMMNEMYKDGKSVFVMLGHYGNWEWVPSIALWSPETISLAQIYRHLSNDAANRYFLKLRSRFGTQSIEKNDTYREILRGKGEGKQLVVGFIADQTPSKNAIHYWTTFMNHETACLTGAEKLAKKIDANVVYLDVQRVARGYYEATFRPITTDARNTAEFEITEKFMRYLERTIERGPAYWLWSHKRWKYSRKKYV